MKKKFLKFFVLWGLTFWINLWLTYILINFILLNPNLSYFIALFLVAIINFLSSLKLIFWVNYYHKTLINYIAVLVIIMLSNFLITSLFINLLWESFRYLVIFFVTSFFFVLKFFVYNKFVFIKRD